MDFEDFASFFHLKSDSEMTSVSGWVMEQFGRVPENGERAFRAAISTCWSQRSTITASRKSSSHRKKTGAGAGGTGINPGGKVRCEYARGGLFRKKTTGNAGGSKSFSYA